MCTLSVSNVIYHKFSHFQIFAFYTLNGKNVNVMFELFLIETICCDPSSESSHRDSSDEGTQHMVLWRINKNYP